MRLSTSTSLAAIICAAASPAMANEAADSQDRAIDRITVTASKADALDVGGSVQRLDIEDLETFASGDVNRILRQVPGVFLQEEEGFGLRPNIGIRGSGTDRNARVAIMEDGVLMAPAPYSAPAAYYFPRMARIHAIEVAKGPAAIKYGPSTVGGAINFFATPIPDVDAGEVAARATALYGNHDSQRLHGWVGGWAPLGGDVEIGALVEGLYEHSDGFKDLDIGGSTGFQISDYTARLGLRSADRTHSLELKYQRNDERSDETYLGLTLADFAATPNRRYNSSQLDEMNVEHETYQLSHYLELAPELSFSTIAYRTDTARSWYKLNDVRNAADTGWNSLSAVLADPTAFAVPFADIVGAEAYTGRAGALRVRNNNRVYQTTGVQSVLSAGFATGSIGHTLELSARYHEDSEDRFQQDDRYQIVNQRMFLTSAGAPGSQDNRVGDAKAWAFFIRDTIEAGDLTLVPGLRYETIDLRQTRWALGDVARTTPTSVTTRKVDVFIPGISAAYRLADDVRLVAGAHKGFNTPSPGSTVDIETSWNYEAGVKLGNADWQFEAIGFFNDYTNMVGTCTASTGGNCNIGDQFDGGGVDVKGLEVLAGTTLGDRSVQGGPAFPVSLAYTFTNARFQSDFVSGYEPWGAVQKGDRLPYQPTHQIALNAGVELDRMSLNTAINWVSETRSTAGQGPIAVGDRINARVLVDLAAEFDVTDNVSVFGTVQNVFGETYNAGFSPSGARPGAPRLWMIGLRGRI
ncbi:TonB-dependent receptor [Altererythrobacter sp. KTW20L]|uniref:TonB-dependent receptor family protein n=1 Tax=Altererythrobacter sp. KTW20L TaxID=2942210 RepID=UPI0020BF11B8|nr:TonB-dependent receptor [Altererythrobacter sp. KTW20L]MCL6250422.1 TonB-dependent receptor [Altererythrobacter sp. KTW20L]